MGVSYSPYPLRGSLGYLASCCHPKGHHLVLSLTAYKNNICLSIHLSLHCYYCCGLGTRGPVGGVSMQSRCRLSGPGCHQVGVCVWEGIGRLDTVGAATMTQALPVALALWYGVFTVG